MEAELGQETGFLDSGPGLFPPQSLASEFHTMCNLCVCTVLHTQRMLRNATAPEEIVLHSEGEVKVRPMESALTWMLKALFLGNLAT